MDQYNCNDKIIKTEANEKIPSRVFSEPVGIPGSPNKFAASRQNSQESCDAENEYYYDGN